ncbi:hypothetical protein GCK32_001232 [Trichostrongylus colubriformis]|uniref:DUF3752 domain-containing protein n=1 Tax=Trichostrongylus colubriformis TaxID=6319 RepID=A0AAN8IJ85_TRICO
MESEQHSNDPAQDILPIPNRNPDMNPEIGNDRSGRFLYRDNNAMVIAAESLSAETLSSTTGSDWSAERAPEENLSDELESVASGIPPDWFSGSQILDMKISVGPSASGGSLNVTADSDERRSLSDGVVIGLSNESVLRSDPVSENDVASARSPDERTERTEPSSKSDSALSILSSSSGEGRRGTSNGGDTGEGNPDFYTLVDKTNAKIDLPDDDAVAPRTGHCVSPSSSGPDLVSAHFIGPFLPTSRVGPSSSPPTIGPSLSTSSMESSHLPFIGPSPPTSGTGPSLPLSSTSGPIPSPHQIGPSLPSSGLESSIVLPSVGLSPPTSEIGPSLLLPSMGPSPPTSGIGPSLPSTMGPYFPHQQVGLSLPNMGPSLPPQNIGPAPHHREIGPALPPGLAYGCNDNQDDDEECFGPMPPVSMGAADGGDNMEMDEPIGPMPIPRDAVEGAAEEYALLRMRMEKKEDENKPKREDWMLKVPEKVANYGLGARQFKRGSSAMAELDKSWEDSPQAKKACCEEGVGIRRTLAEEKRDEEQRRLAEALNSDRKESFVDAQLKAKKGTTPQNPTTSGERVAFDREKDMGGAGSKKMSLEEVRERAGHLGSRFAPGSSQNYL